MSWERGLRYKLRKEAGLFWHIIKQSWEKQKLASSSQTHQKAIWSQNFLWIIKFYSIWVSFSGLTISAGNFVLFPSALQSGELAVIFVTTASICLGTKDK